MKLLLNSKRLNLHKWWAIAELLGLLTDAMLTETRLIVEVKSELGHEPTGVQIVLRDSRFCIVFGWWRGIIKRVDMTAHVIRDKPRELGASECSALHGTSELERLR